MRNTWLEIRLYIPSVTLKSIQSIGKERREPTGKNSEIRKTFYMAKNRHKFELVRESGEVKGFSVHKTTCFFHPMNGHVISAIETLFV